MFQEIIIDQIFIQSFIYSFSYLFIFYLYTLFW